jgi:hypothetical protein
VIFNPAKLPTGAAWICSILLKNWRGHKDDRKEMATSKAPIQTKEPKRAKNGYALVENPDSHKKLKSYTM